MKNRIIKGSFLILFIYILSLSYSSDTLASNNLNLQKEVDYEYNEVSYETKYVIDRDLKSKEEVIAVLGKNGVSAKYEFGEEEIVIYEPIVEIIEIGPIESFGGQITGYGPDCVGCSGKVGCSPYQNVKNGNIYFEDEKYGKIRIVAADKRISCGSIVVISNYIFEEEPIIAIVLDRGGAITGNKMDLLYNAESETVVVGRQYNIQFDILRQGW